MNEDELDPDDDDPDNESQLNDDSDVSELQHLRTGDETPLKLRKLVDLYTWCAITSPSPGWQTQPWTPIHRQWGECDYLVLAIHLCFEPCLAFICFHSRTIVKLLLAVTTYLTSHKIRIGTGSFADWEESSILRLVEFFLPILASFKRTGDRNRLGLAGYNGICATQTSVLKRILQPPCGESWTR